MTANAFDPDAYKRTTRDQWQEAAAAWHAWGPTLEVWLGQATELMLERAGLARGSRVLDLAAGAGGQTIAAARLVGDEGAVLATDIAPDILEFAAARARSAGLSNVATQEMDGEQLAFADASFDAVISRLGLIYFPDRAGALRDIRRVLLPGGRVATIGYSTPDRNAFFSIPVSIVRRAAGLPAPEPGLPGPFSMAGDGVMGGAFEQAGFTNVEVAAVDAPLRLASAAEFVRFARESFGALHTMLAGVDEPQRAAAWAEMEREMSQFEGPDGFVGPCELLVGAGTAP